MKECIKTDNPCVTILMATYNPNRQWLFEQLDSLNSQDYENLKLIVLDDCSPDFSLEELSDILKNHIINFDFKALRNSENLGSTKTFEQLVSMADTPLISFCDQDDVWLPFKISQSVNDLISKDSVLSCSDVMVIDGEGKATHNSVKEVWKNHDYFEGENLTQRIISKNFIIGCTALMKTEIAKMAIPFSKYMVHDQWLGIIASMYGKISVCEGISMKYRIHGENQTGTLAKINTKKDYYEKRILPFFESMVDLKAIAVDNIYVERNFKWAKARKNYYNGKFFDFIKILKYSGNNFRVSMFDIAIKFMPKGFFSKVIKQLKQSK